MIGTIKWARDEDYFIRVENAVKEYYSDEYDGPIKFLATKYNVNYKTLYDRIKGKTNGRGTFSLHEWQERLIEADLIFLIQNKTPWNQHQTRKFAAKLKGKEGPLSPSWVLGFLKRHPKFLIADTGHLDILQNEETAESPISIFFKEYFFYVNNLKVAQDRIFYLDEACFRIESLNSAQIVIPGRASHIKSYDCLEFLTVLEFISKDGTIGEPLFVCKGDDYVMTGWSETAEHTYINFALSSNGFINEDAFIGWIDSQFSKYTDGEIRLLIMDGHFSQISTEVLQKLNKYNVVPINLPRDMTTILQPSDRIPFENFKLLFENESNDDVSEGLSLQKKNFINNYLNQRLSAYSLKVIEKGFDRCGLNCNDQESALAQYQLKSEKVLAKNRSFEQLASEQPFEIPKRSAKYLERAKRKEMLQNLEPAVSKSIREQLHEHEQTIKKLKTEIQFYWERSYQLQQKCDRLNDLLPESKRIKSSKMERVLTPPPS